jgi:hypothetical protein
MKSMKDHEVWVWFFGIVELMNELLLDIDSTLRIEVNRFRHKLIKRCYIDIIEDRVQGVDGNEVIEKIRIKLNGKS